MDKKDHAKAKAKATKARQIASWLQKQQFASGDDLGSLFDVDTDYLAVPRFRFCVGLLFLLSLISLFSKWAVAGTMALSADMKIQVLLSALLLCFGMLSFVPQFRKSCYAFTIMLAVFVGAASLTLQIRGAHSSFDQMVTMTLFFVLMGFLMPWGGWATASVCMPLYLFYPMTGILSGHDMGQEWFLKSNIYLIFFMVVSTVSASMSRRMRFVEFGLKKQMENENRVLQDYQVRLKRAYERVETLALIDTLTGAYNRSYFTRWLTSDLYTDKDCKQVFSMIMFDVDGFKTINDLGGHQQGDRILQLVADRVKHSIEARTLVFRYGGDEFCVVLPALELAEAVEVAEALRQDIQGDPNLVVVLPSRDSFHVTISIGVTTEYPSTSTVDVDFLIKWVDAALLESKRQGRNCVHVFDPIDRKIMSASDWLSQGDLP